MAETKESLVWDLIKRQLRNERNKDVYEERLKAPRPLPGFDYVPRCIYFYYVRIDNSGMVRADHYFYANGPADDPSQWQPIPYADAVDRNGIIRTLALNARPSTRIKNPPKLDSDSFDNVVWNRRSYVAIFFDEGIGPSTGGSATSPPSPSTSARATSRTRAFSTPPIWRSICRTGVPAVPTSEAPSCSSTI